MTNKELFTKIYKDNIKREGAVALLEYINKTDFFTAPASAKYHEDYEGGLVEHSINVYNALSKLNKELNLGFTDESVAIISLLHDLCKIGYYKVEYRNRKNEQGKWEQYPFYTTDDAFPYGHGEKSVYMITQCMDLTYEEAMAIRWHMGAYEGERSWGTLSKAFTDNPKIMYLHFADMIATYHKESVK